MPAARPLAAMTASRTAGVTRPPTPYTVSVGKQTRRAAASSPASRGPSPPSGPARSMRRAPLTASRRPPGRGAGDRPHRHAARREVLLGLARCCRCRSGRCSPPAPRRPRPRSSPSARCSQGADAAGGDHRHPHLARHRARELQVVAVERAVAVHAGEHELAGAQLGRPRRPLDGVDARGRAPAVDVDLPAERPALLAAPRDPARVDGDHDALRAEALAAAAHELGVVDGGRVHGHLVGAGGEDGAHVVDAREPAADGERDEHLLGAARREVDDDVAALVRGGDVEEDELVGALGVVARRQLDGVAGVADVDEVDALDHAPVADVEARDDALAVHGAAASRRRWPARRPA